MGTALTIHNYDFVEAGIYLNRRAQPSNRSRQGNAWNAVSISVMHTNDM